MISGAHKLAPLVISELIEEARDAEICRNISMMREALAPVWPNIDAAPDFAGFDTLTEARLLRLCGFLLSFEGKSINRPEYHLRAKDMLSSAANLFASVGASDEEAEANIMLGLSYWYEGQVEECEAILNVVERSCVSPSDPVLLQMQVHRLMIFHYQERFEDARCLIDQFGQLALKNLPIRHVGAFYNQAGLIFERSKDYSAAAHNFELALAAIKQAGNPRFEGLLLNNRAILNLSAGFIADATRDAEEALTLFERLGDRGWIPHILDTKALILMESGYLESALGVIDESIELFKKGSDHAGLCDSKWTRTRILLRASLPDEALQTFACLHSLAGTYIGSTACAKYTKLLVEELGLSKVGADIDRLHDLSTSDGLEIFFVSSTVMSRFGIQYDCAVPVRPQEVPMEGMPVIYAADGTLHLDRVRLDEFTRIYHITHDPDFPSPVDDVPVIGECLGYCSIAEIGTGRVNFQDFPSM